MLHIGSVVEAPGLQSCGAQAKLLCGMWDLPGSDLCFLHWQVNSSQLSQGKPLDKEPRGWCTGTTQRDGMGREEGGGFRMGNTCISVADSFRYLAKTIQYCKV